MPNTHETLGDLFSDIADAIRAKTGSSDTIIADDFPDEIADITTGVDISDTTATAGDVLNGEIFYTSDGTQTTGTIPVNSSSDITVSGDTVSVSAGYYADPETASVASGSATTPATTITATPTISVSSGGLITASVSETQSVTPTVSAGYITTGTAGTISVSGSNTSQMTTKAATTYSTSSSNQTIAAGTYLTGDQTFRAVTTSNISAANVKKGVVVKVGDAGDDDRIAGVTGTYTTVSSGQSAVVAGAMLSGYSGFANGGAEVKGTIASKSSSDVTSSNNTVSVPAGYYSSAVSKTVGTAKAATTFNVSGSNQTIAAGTYLTGTQTFRGVTTANISAGNIKKGVTITVGDAGSSTRIANVTGTYTTVSSGQTAVTAGAMLSGYSGFANGGAEVKGTIASKAAATYYATTSDQTIAAGKYLSGAQTIKKITATNLSAANIKSGVTISVNNGSSNVWSVTGTAPIRYAYTTTVKPSATTGFSCSSNTGVTTKSFYYVSFNPGFTPSTILITSASETLRRAMYDSSQGYYVVVMDGGSWWACRGYTITSSSVIVPTGQYSENVYIKCFA